MSKQKIVSIEIELKDYEPIKFTMAEAKELHEQLDALFGEKVRDVHHYHKDYWWNKPHYAWYSNVSGTPVASTTTKAITASSNLAGMQATSSNTNMKVSYLAGQ